MKNIVIIGAGIIGTMTARALTMHGHNVTVLERNHDIALEATGANSGIIHAGNDPEDGTLKARFNLEGAAMWPDLCSELGIDYKRCGALILKCAPEESLDKLEQRAIDRGIEVHRLNRDQLLKMEPHLSDHVMEGLHLPSAAVFTPWQAAIAAMEEAILNGASLQLDTEVQSIHKEADTFLVGTTNGTFQADAVINCAGIHADDIARMAGNDTFSIRNRKGEYFILKQRKHPFSSSILYPVPGPAGKGILCTPTVHGNILLGPNAQFVDDKEDTACTAALDTVARQLEKTVTGIPWQDVIRTFAGSRPCGSTGDFVIEEDESVPGLIHVACIESPGLSSAPAIARYVQETWFPGEAAAWTRRRKPIVFQEQTEAEKVRLAASDPAYGRIVCRCEQISEAEILDAIRRPAGARTVDGVKKRVRPGMGECQGGFCTPEIIRILSRELGIPETEVQMKNTNTPIVKGKAKDAYKGI